MNESTRHECCPRFDPEPWIDREVVWEEKRFLKDRVTSCFHIPLNFGAVMKRNLKAMEAAGATSEDMVVLSDETSLWGADVYIAVSQDVPGVNMATLSGTFLCKVFDGPYRNLRTWIEDMTSHVQGKGKTIRKLYFFYTTCPKCSKKHGHNYVVLFAQV